MREQIRLHAGNSFYTSVNSLLEQEGQGGSLSYSPTLTSVWQLVQLYVPLPGFSPVLQTCFIVSPPRFFVIMSRTGRAMRRTGCKKTEKEGRAFRSFCCLRASDVVLL